MSLLNNIEIILSNKFKTHPDYERFKIVDLNIDNDGSRYAPEPLTTIGFEFTSKIEGRTVSYQSFGGRISLDFDKIRCIEKSYLKGISPAFFKKVDKVFETELVIAVLTYYVVELGEHIDFNNKKLVKFIDNNSVALRPIYEFNGDTRLLPTEIQDVFLF